MSTRSWVSGLSVAIALAAFSADTAIADPEGEMPVVFREDFEDGIANWKVLDPKTWRLNEKEGATTFEITQRESEYEPAVRSPLHIALIEGKPVGDCEITFRVRSTKDTGAHRDCCVFFGYQDPTNYYYVHLGARPDPASGQIMIVDDAPRRPLTKNTKEVPWDDDWHNVKLVRSVEEGTIQVFFDDMERPIMQATDNTFGRGLVGIGSFDDCNEFDDIVLRGK